MQNAQNIRCRTGFMLAVILFASAVTMLTLSPGTALANPGAYAVTDLDLTSLPSNNGVKATKTNDSGDVIGFYTDADYYSQAFRYRNGQLEELSVPGAEGIYALDLNNSGDVVGYYADNGENHAFLYQNGQMQDLDDLIPAGSGNTLTKAVDIDDSGQVIGYYRDASFSRRVFVYQNGQMQDLNALPGGASGEITAVNDSGQMAGSSFDGDASERAFLYSDGQTTDLGAPTDTSSFANDLNDSGQVAGYYRDTNDNAYAFLYDGQLEKLPTLGRAENQALGINNSGQAVGFAETANGFFAATLWENGQVVDLNTLVPSGSGVTLTEAADINQYGTIVANGRDASFADHVLLLTSLDRDGDGVLDDSDACPNDPGSAPDGCPPPPDNDAFAAAETVSGDGNAVDGNNFLATRETGEPDHLPNDPGSSGEQSVWYSWTPQTSKSVTIDTCESDFDTVLAVYQGSAVDGLSRIAGGDQGCASGDGSKATFDAQAGAIYKIAVSSHDLDGSNGFETGDFTLKISETPQADVSVGATAAPDPVVLGQNVTYTLTALNNGPDPAEGVEGSLAFEDAAAMIVSVPSGCEASTTGTTEDVSCQSPDTVPGGGQKQWQIVLKPSGAGTLTVEAYAYSANTADPNPDNQHLEVQTTVQPPAPDGDGDGVPDSSDECPTVPANTANGCPPPNRAPVAGDDSYTTDEDTPLTVQAPGVLDNDTDADGDFFHAFDEYTDPVHGTLTINDLNGSFTYTPDGDYHGDDSFTYKANDGTDQSNSATVNITVKPVNDRPRAENATRSMEEDATPISIDFAGLVSDKETSDANLAYDVTAPGAAQGTLSGTGSTRAFDPADNFNGTVEILYGVTDRGDPDGCGAPVNGCDASETSDQKTLAITVSPVNDAPVAANDSVTTQEDTAVTGNVLGNDTDVDGNPLTVAAPRPVSGPAHGALTLDSNGSFTYTPAGDYNGSDSFTYKASDGTVNSNTATVNITVAAVNDRPVAQGQTLETDEDTAKAVTLSATDAENGALSYTVVSGPQHGSLSGTGSSLTYTPAGDYNGSDSFTYRASDGSANSASATVAITVRPVNDAPTAQDDTASARQGVAADIIVLANDTDVDGDPLTVSAVTAPAHGTATINPDGTVRYVPAAGYTGPDSFTYTASDGKGGTDTATVSVAVQAPPPPADTAAPTISGMTPKPDTRIRDRTPTIKATIRDNVTNLQESDVKLYINGKAVSASKFSYNASNDGLVYNSPKLSSGKQTVKIVATDAAGNAATKSWSFTIKK